jgi:hypothetical protein
VDCPKCGAANLDKATQCGHCAAELPRTARARGWFLQHPLVVTLSGALVAGLCTVIVALINTGSGEKHTLISVEEMQEDAFVKKPADPETPNRNVAPAFPNEPPLPEDWISNGSRDGLYAPADCAVDALIADITAPEHTSQAKAWAGAAGIQPADIPAYFRSLTPVRLRFDTRVTNYDYRDGHADGYQAVLQAGTTVLIDNRGVPRAKCNCGNPLAKPSDSGSTDDDVDDYASNPENAWDGFNPTRVATVTSGQRVDQFVLMDLDDGQVYRRPVGSGSAGDVAVGPGDPACGTLGESTSCGGPGPQATPEDIAQLEKTLNRLAEAVERGDCQALMDAMSSAVVQQFGTGDLAGCQQLFDVVGSLGGITVDAMRVISQTGAQAVVEVTMTLNGETVTQPNNFVRENGNWKVGL